MTRLDPWTVAPDQVGRLVDYSIASGEGMDPGLKALVKIRASQINGCARCLHMHIGEGRKARVTDERLYMVSAWRETPIYSARERAALAWTEALTQLAVTHAPDEAYQGLAPHFSEPEIVQLTLLIATINTFNMLAVGFRLPPMGLTTVAEAA